MVYLNDEVLDQGLDYADTNGTRVDLCSQEPVTYAEATSTYTLCNKTGVNTGAPEDGGSSGGRRVVIPEITDGDVTGTGTATHWALTDGAAVLIATGALLAPRSFTSGNKFRLEAITITIHDAEVTVVGSGLLTNLVSYWDMSETGSFTARADSHGSNDLAVDIAAVTSRSDGPGGATMADFGGSNGRLKIDDNASVSVGDTDWTLVYWLRFDAIGAGVQKIVSKDSEFRTIYTGTGGTDRFKVTVYDSGLSEHNVESTTFGAASINTNYMLALICDKTGGTVGISVNAGTINTVAHGFTGNDAAAQFQVPHADLEFDGGICRCGLWKGEALSAAQLTALYNAGAGLAYAELT